MWVSLSLRLLSLVFIGLQAALIDWYLVYYSSGKNSAWLAWITADLIVLGTFIGSYLYADFYFQQNQFEKLRAEVPKETLNARKRALRRAKSTGDKASTREERIQLASAKKDANRHDDGIVDADDLVNWNNMEENIRVANLKVGKIRKKYKLGSLPLVYISWSLYAVVLAAKLIIIFATFGEELDVHILWQANMLELAFASTSVIFALVASGHKKIPSKTHQKPIIRWMQTHVMLDILDSTEILECLYENGGAGTKHKIDPSIQAAILAFVSIQFLLPSVGLYQLSATNFAHDGDPPAYFSMIQLMLSMIFGNIPFLVIRIYLILQHQFTESAFIFIIKNVYGIVTNTYEFIHWIRLVRESRKDGKDVYAFEEEDD